MEVLAIKSCLYTYSTDEDFIVDFLHNHDNKVIVASGFSGHGFKFVPVIGELLGDLALQGHAGLNIDFLSFSMLS